ncbi:MAG: hypothetical protein IK079_02215 [Desulfovibrio sp.]|nr:hypothetical protein [Desulfovibrio sp.]
MAVAVNQKGTTALDYEIYPGSIVDMTECEYMLQRMDDYGYTKDNILFLDNKGYDFIMMADECTLFIRKLIAELSGQLKHDASLFLMLVLMVLQTFSS